MITPEVGTACRVMLLTVLVVLAGCAGAGSEPSGTPTVIVEMATDASTERSAGTPTPSQTATVSPNSTSKTAEAPTSTPSPGSTETAEPPSTPTPAYPSLLTVDGTVDETETHWHVTWTVTNEADTTVFYEFNPVHKLVAEDGEVRTARLRVADRAFDPGETVTYEWSYNKENWEERGWDDRGPYAVDIEVDGYEILE